MSPQSLLLVVTLMLALGVLVYWLIWTTEGSYLGRWAVRWIYDRGASSYDGVKQYDPLDEAAFLGNPISSRLEEAFGPHPLLLDVATGTGRLPAALLAVPFFRGEIVALDLSRGMLREAARKLESRADAITLLHHPAAPLPFEDATFDAVSSMEALEFMPDRRAALAEMVRVLRPGGWLFITNRVGLDARLMPGRSDPPEALERRLERLGMIEINTRPWQEYYDLIFARLPGRPAPGSGFSGAWLAAFRCPHCDHPGGAIAHGRWLCAVCGAGIDIAADGVWEMGG